MSSLTLPPHVLIAHLIIAYFTLAPQSNIVFMGPSAADCPHVLKVGGTSHPSHTPYLSQSDRLKQGLLLLLTSFLGCLPCRAPTVAQCKPGIVILTRLYYPLSHPAIHA